MSQMEQNSRSSQGGLRMQQPQYQLMPAPQSPSATASLASCLLNTRKIPGNILAFEQKISEFLLSIISTVNTACCLLQPESILILSVCVCLVSPRQGLARNSVGIHLMANMENPRILKVQKKKKSLMCFPDSCKSSTFPIITILRLTEGRERRKHRP